MYVICGEMTGTDGENLWKFGESVGRQTMV